MTTRFLICLAEGLIEGETDQLSAITKARCDRAVEAWATGEYDLLFVSGGMFFSRGTQTVPIAQTMRGYMAERGVPRDCILVEGDSLDTYENVRFLMQMIQPRLHLHECEFTICTQLQHGIRAAITLWRLYGVRARLIPVRQPTMSWWEWWKEWLLLIPYHLWDREGRGFIARQNRAKRRARTRE